MKRPVATRPTLLAAALALGSLFAQIDPARSAPPGEAPQGDVSLAHSASKAATFNIAVVLTNFVVFTAGTGSVIGGGILTAVNVTKSLLLYTLNDYAWDTYFPAAVNPDEGNEFDASQTVRRTTEKFLTYKPLSIAIKFASIFVYTGSIPVMIVYGTASEAASTGIFFLNNFAWDAYDWSRAVSQASAEEAPAESPRLTLGRRRPEISP